MATLYFLKGLPGSGKTTWALKNAPILKAVRVNKDDIRAKNPKWKEKDVVEFERRLVDDNLGLNASVIVDNTHLNPIHEEYYSKLCLNFGDEFVVVDHFLSIPVAECVRRDSLRQNPVGEKTIRRMWQKWLKPSVPLYSPDPSLPPAIICDIDGTVAEVDGRSYYDMSKVLTDRPRVEIINAVKALQGSWERPFLIFVTGRDSGCYLDTYEWLRNQKFCDFGLLMRGIGDDREDAIVKRELFDGEIRDVYRVVGVFDDRPRVVKMWQSLGLPVFCVNTCYEDEF